MTIKPKPHANAHKPELYADTYPCENCKTTTERDEWLISRLDAIGAYFVNKTDDPEAREAYATLLYVRSMLNLDAEEYRAVREEARQT